MLQVKLSEVLPYLESILSVQAAQLLAGEPAPVVPYIQAKPGIGKSAVLSRLRGSVEKVVIEEPALRPTEYFSGIPTPAEEGEVKWSVPEALKRIIEEAQNTDGWVLWVWDDFHLAPGAIQKYLMELLTWRELHGVKLPDNVLILLIGNDSKKAGAERVLTPIQNRLAVLSVGPDLDAWVEWATTGQSKLTDYPVEILTGKETLKVHELVVKFIQRYPEYFATEEAPRPFASPRSWTALGRLLTVLDNRGQLNPFSLKYTAQGLVGEKVAGEFASFAELLIGIDWRKILNEGPEKFEQELRNSPNDAALKLWGFFNSLAKAIERGESVDTGKLHKFLLHFIDNSNPEEPQLKIADLPGAAAEYAAGLRRVKEAYLKVGKEEEYTEVMLGPDGQGMAILTWVLSSA